MKKQYVKPQMEAVIINGMQLMSNGSVASVNGNVFKSGVSAAAAMPAAVAATGTTRSEEVRSVKSSFILIITRVCPPIGSSSFLFV